MKPRWYEHALLDNGIHEIAGPSAEKRIVTMASYTELSSKSDEVAWCSSAMNCWMAESGLPYTKSAAARSWGKWGVKLDKPIEGCVVILNRGGPKDINEAGPAHVTLFDSKQPGGYIKCFGGNQSDMVKYSIFREDQVLGYRWPKGEPIPDA